jgi:hypothetical protein
MKVLGRTSQRELEIRSADHDDGAKVVLRLVRPTQGTLISRSRFRGRRNAHTAGNDLWAQVAGSGAMRGLWTTLPCHWRAGGTAVALNFPQNGVGDPVGHAALHGLLVGR